MSHLLLIPVCLIAGFLLKRRKLLPANAPLVLNVIVIWLAFPSLVLTVVPTMLNGFRDQGSMTAPLLAVWFAFPVSAAFILLGARRWGWSRATTGALMLTAGLGNTSFIGFPLIEALYGNRGLQYALVLDQTGSFLVLSTFGILSASWFSGAKVSPHDLAKKIFLFPPFIALLFAVAVNGSALLDQLKPALERLGGTLVPLALLSVGSQLQFDKDVLKNRGLTLGYGLTIKLIAAPLLFALLLKLTRCQDLACRVSVMELAMGPMITGAILAGEFGLDEEIANLMVGVGTPLSLITVWLWHSFY